MARARNIKPSFFDNEELAQCEPLARLLFIGLWCVADREGRLEDRPIRLKHQILGYDDCEIEPLLEQLASKGVITRYKVPRLPTKAASASTILVNRFLAHQKPHHNEVPSVLPPPGDLEPETPKEHKPTGSKPRLPAKVVSASTIGASARADSLSLIPDSKKRIARTRASKQPKQWDDSIDAAFEKRYGEAAGQFEGTFEIHLPREKFEGYEKTYPDVDLGRTFTIMADWMSDTKRAAGQKGSDAKLKRQAAAIRLRHSRGDHPSLWAFVRNWLAKEQKKVDVTKPVAKRRGGDPREEKQ